MNENDNLITNLVTSPSESLSLEMKDWIDPDYAEGIEKIVKAALAMRNNDGGYLLIGFNDRDGSPNFSGAPADVPATFHIDKIQGYITKYSSESFEVKVHFPVINEQQFVVLDVPKGIKTPVATKSGLPYQGRELIKVNKVYVRTLEANNTPSTAEATWKDWPKITEKCFENRETDIGKFLRRHLGTSLALQEYLQPLPNPENDLTEFLTASRTKFDEIVTQRALQLPTHGAMEVAIKVEGDFATHRATRDFLNLLQSNNEMYTGWPVWVDSRNFTDERSRPYLDNGAWEAFVASFSQGFNSHLDYWRLLPEGEFYLYRAFQDDIGGSEHAPLPNTELDYGLVILRVAECVAKAITFAKALEATDDASLLIKVRWTGLQGRNLSDWANPERWIHGYGPASQDSVESTIAVPLSTPLTAISTYVHEIVSDLFVVFGGTEISAGVTEDLVQRLLSRNL